jgi:prevent-host-death family protein
MGRAEIYRFAMAYFGGFMVHTKVCPREGRETDRFRGRGDLVDKQASLSSLFGMKTSETSMGAFEAKNKFSELLERVGRGAEITITKHDHAVARLVPAVSQTNEGRKKATAELRALRVRYSLKGLSVRTLIEQGRK